MVKINTSFSMQLCFVSDHFPIAPQIMLHLEKFIESHSSMNLIGVMSGY